MNYGRPCGTCRFGAERASSVLDRDCRIHDVPNLYVVDASFMPRSGAINPSLTIAANAFELRPKLPLSYLYYEDAIGAAHQRRDPIDSTHIGIPTICKGVSILPLEF